MWHRGGADEATAPARRSLQGPCRCEGSGVTSGEGEQLQEVWQDRSSVGKELRGRGPQKPSKRLKWAAPERWQGRETRPEFLERKLTPEQLGLEWCGSTYTWILFSTKHFRTTCSTENHGCRLMAMHNLQGDALLWRGQGLEAFAPACVRGSSVWINSFGNRSAVGGEDKAQDVESAFLGLDSTCCPQNYVTYQVTKFQFSHHKMEVGLNKWLKFNQFKWSLLNTEQSGWPFNMLAAFHRFLLLMMLL